MEARRTGCSYALSGDRKIWKYTLVEARLRPKDTSDQGLGLLETRLSDRTYDQKQKFDLKGQALHAKLGLIRAVYGI